MSRQKQGNRDVLNLFSLNILCIAMGAITGHFVAPFIIQWAVEVGAVVDIEGERICRLASMLIFGMIGWCIAMALYINSKM